MKLDEKDLRQLTDWIDQNYHGSKSNEDILKHLKLEVEELVDASKNLKITKSIDNIKARAEEIKEFGDVLYCLLCYANNNDIDPNYALLLTITKLMERKKYNV